jgi:hypothetical protein
MHPSEPEVTARRLPWRQRGQVSASLPRLSYSGSTSVGGPPVVEPCLEDWLEVTRVAVDRGDGDDHVEYLLERDVVADHKGAPVTIHICVGDGDAPGSGRWPPRHLTLPPVPRPASRGRLGRAGRPIQRHPAAAQGPREVLAPAPDLVERGQIGREQHIEVEARVLQADGYAVPLQDQPHADDTSSTEIELDHHPLHGQLPALDSVTHPPRQQGRVKVDRLGILECPTRAPGHELLGERLELEPGRTWPAAGVAAPLDDAVALQLPQAPGE